MSKRRRRLNATPSQAELIRSSWLSAQNVFFFILICLSMTGLFAAMAMKQQTWTEAVIVLGICWFIWCAVLSGILFNGVRDDDVLGQPTYWFARWLSADQSQNKPNHSWKLGSGWQFLLMDGRVCVLLVGVLLSLALDNVPPVFGFIMMLLLIIRTMLAIMRDDRHHCRGNMPRSALWGMTWATIFAVTLAGAVIWLIHRPATRPLFSG